jgi:hypothetical protein
MQFVTWCIGYEQLLHSMVILSLIYIGCKRDPDTQVSIWGVLRVQSNLIIQRDTCHLFSWHSIY